MLGIVWSNAATKQEGRIAGVIGENTPVELGTVSSDGFPLGVEEKVVYKTFIGLGLDEVFDCGDIEGLDETGADGKTVDHSQGADIVRRLMTVQLDVVEGVVGIMLTDVIDGGIDKDTNAFTVGRQIAGALADISARFGPENEE